MELWVFFFGPPAKSSRFQLFFPALGKNPLAEFSNEPGFGVTLLADARAALIIDFRVTFPVAVNRGLVRLRCVPNGPV